MSNNLTRDELAVVLRTGYSSIILEADEWRPLADHVLSLVEAGVAEERERALAELDGELAKTEQELAHDQGDAILGLRVAISKLRRLRAAIATATPRILERDHRGDVVAVRLPDGQIVTFDPPVPEAAAQPSGTSVLVELVMADDAYLQAAKGSPAVTAGRRLDAAWVAARSLVLPAQPSGEEGSHGDRQYPT